MLNYKNYKRWAGQEETIGTPSSPKCEGRLKLVPTDERPLSKQRVSALDSQKGDQRA
jgi:hypothetical protein